MRSSCQICYSQVPLDREPRVHRHKLVGQLPTLLRRGQRVQGKVNGDGRLHRPQGGHGTDQRQHHTARGATGDPDSAQADGLSL